MIVDAALVIDAVADPGRRGQAARAALKSVPAAEVLRTPGHFAFEVMSGLRSAVNRPHHPLQPADLPAALQAAAGLGIIIEGTPWPDVERAWALAQGSLRYADAIYVAAGERHQSALLTANAQIEKSGAATPGEVIPISPPVP